MAALDPEAPPVGEELHLPGSSLVPILNAAGLATALVGLTLSWYLVAAGGLLFVITLVRWIADTRHEIAELPAEHDSH
jgi:hypothetical protein